MEPITMIADALLTVATGSGVQVERAFVAPGPQFARVCRLLAVYVAGIQVRPFDSGDFAGGTCATRTQVVYAVVFTADCCPLPEVDGSNVKLPDSAAISGWSTAFLDDVGKVHDAIHDAKVDGTFGDCGSVTIGDAIPTGPTGGTASVSIPVTVALSV